MRLTGSESISATKRPAKSAHARRYRTFEHTADCGIWAYGTTLNQAFENAAYGLFSIITDLLQVKEEDTRSFEFNETGYEELLYAWLNELIFLFDTRSFICKRAEIIRLDNGHLKAICYGESYDPSRHHLKCAVKAATYNLMEVDTEKNRIRVVFDL